MINWPWGNTQEFSSPFFFHIDSGNASLELLVLVSVSQFDSSHPLTGNGKSCQDLTLPTLNSPYYCEAMSQRLHLVKINNKHQIIRSSYLKGLFAFSYVLEFAEEKKYLSLIFARHSTRNSLGHCIYTLQIILSFNLPIPLFPILKLSPYDGTQLR